MAQWFRMHSDAVDDDKLRLLAFEDRWHFVALLCLKSSGMLDDGLPHLERRIAVKLGLQLSALDEVKRRLVEVCLIDESFQPLGWDRRQYLSDHSGKERTKRWRDKQKNSCDVTETSQKRQRDVAVTPSETESDTEKDNTSTSSTAVAKVFDHWKVTHQHPRAKLDKKRMRTIQSALKLYPLEDLCKAISGYRKSEFHMGKNEDRKVYDDVELMLRGSKQIEHGLKCAETGGNVKWL